MFSTSRNVKKEFKINVLGFLACQKKKPARECKWTRAFMSANASALRTLAYVCTHEHKHLCAASKCVLL